MTGLVQAGVGFGIAGVQMQVSAFESNVERGFDLDFLIDQDSGEGLFQASYLRGYGTLYSAVYRPAERQVELHWPGVQPWRQSVAAFAPGQREITYASSGE